MSERLGDGGRSASSLLAWIFLAAGCGAAVPPPSAPDKGAPSVAAATSQPALALASSAEPAAPPSPGPSPAPLPEPLPALTRPLVPVVLLTTKAGIIHVPEGSPTRREWLGLPRPEIISVHGRSPRDIWLLTSDQIVLHDDGKRIVDRYVRPCGWGIFGESNQIGTRFAQILADKDSVRVLGESRGMDTRVGNDITASFSKAGRWSCGGSGLAPAVASSSGDHTWKLAHNMDWGFCMLRATGGPCAPIPSWAPSFAEPVGDAVDMGIHSIALSMHGLDDGWIVTLDEERRARLLRYNGVTWAPIATLEKGLTVVDLWVDGEAHAWLAVRSTDNWEDPATMVLRSDGHALRPLPVPASFATRLVRGTGPRDVWFVGAGGKVYEWDGAELRQGTVPFDVSDAWSSPGGEVWFVGKEGVAHTSPLGEAR